MTVRFLSGFHNIIQDYDGYIVDLWGVVHDGFETYPGVIDCLTDLIAAKKQVVFLSNAPRRSSLVQTQLAQIGVDRSLYTDLYTSGEDAYQSLRAGGYDDGAYGNRVFALSSKLHQPLYDDLHLIQVSDIMDADFLMNTGPQMESVDDFHDLLEKARNRNLPMICVNPDIQVISGGQVVLCAGALAQKYADMGGDVRYHGKPYPSIYDRVLGLFHGIEKEKILAVGDSLNTDIKGASDAGFHSALVMTGLHKRQMTAKGAPGVLEERAFFEKTCENAGIIPTYLVGGFCL